MGAVKLFQLAWTLFACAALLFQCWAVLDVHRDHGSIDGRSAWWTWLRELLRAYALGWVQLVMMCVGVYAFLGPQPVANRTEGAQIVALLFISVELTLFGISAFSVYVRRHVRHLERTEVMREMVRQAEARHG